MMMEACMFNQSLEYYHLIENAMLQTTRHQPRTPLAKSNLSTPCLHSPLPISEHYLPFNHTNHSLSQLTDRLTFASPSGTTNNYNTPSFNLIKSPRRQSELTSQRVKTLGDEQFSHRRTKRHTLPVKYMQQTTCQQSDLLSPDRLGVIRVNFTYGGPQSGVTGGISSLKQVGTSSLKPVGEAHPRSSVLPRSGNLPRSSVLFCKGKGKVSKMSKMSRNCLCSEQFRVFYSPSEDYGRDIEQPLKLLEQLKVAGDLLPKRSSQCRQFKESKFTAAQSTIGSSINFIKDSGLSLGPREGRSQLQGSRYSYSQPITEQHGFLIDQIRSSKLLGKTIILPSTAYDFGGLINTSKGIILADTSREIEVEPRELEVRGGSQSSRDWNQLRSLLTEQADAGDLKESIHCGPDVRSHKMNCSLLKGFGREINESLVGISESMVGFPE